MVGTDIVLVSRIEEAAGHKNFLKRMLSATEQEYLNGKSKESVLSGHSPYFMSLAGFFAAKEAVLKAIGVGLIKGFGFTDVEIDHVESRQPKVNLSARLQRYIEKLGKQSVHVSVAHDGDYATAVAICI